MSAFSDYAEDKIAKWVAGSTTMPAVGSRYLGLFSSNPTDTGSGGTEVTTTIRSAGRVAISFAAPVDGVLLNSAEINFGNSEHDTSVSHFGIFDAASSGNLLVHGALNNPKTISTSDVVKFAAGALSVTVA